MISILTPCTRVELLPDLAATVLAVPEEFEWLVQLDGAARQREAEVVEMLDDDRVSVESNPQPAGSGTTRNLALIRAAGDRVMCVDDDDLLVPGGVAALAAALDEHPGCFAAWGLSLSFDDDPEAAQPFRFWPRPGVIPAGEITRIFRQTGEFRVHVGACLWRRPYLEAVGGYSALLRSIDTAPFVACERRHPVVYVDQPVYLYRLHPGQMTKSDHYRELRRRTHAHVFARADHLAELW